MTQNRIGMGLLAALMACFVAFACWCMTPSLAWADEVSDARATLADAESQMAAISEEYDLLVKEVEKLQEQIDATVADAMVVQQAVIEGREILGKTMVHEYRGDSTGSWLSVLMGSASFSELLRNIEYINQVMEFQADEIAAQKERKQVLDELSEELNEKKTAQDIALKELEEKVALAESVVAEAQANLANAEAAEAERLKALEEAANRVEVPTQGDPNAEIADDANTIDREDVVQGDSGDSGNSGGNEANESTSGWLSGTASAYGGETDPYTPNPGKTATGAICDDNSMGVAVPMAMPGYRSYFGRTVEISYNGMTVYAVVNDCGYMGGGSRVLDLQPGVWKAFGFKSCRSWGLRTVSYRFL